MPTKVAPEDLAESTKRIYGMLQKADLNPRVKMALRMYAFGACKTLTEAAEVTGLSQSYLSLKKNSPAGEAYMQSAQQILDDKTGNMSEILNRLGRRALEVIGDKMENCKDDKIQLRAAIDLADRAPETSKVQKSLEMSFTIAGKDAKAIAEALVAGKSVNEQFAHLAEGNFDKVAEQPPLLLSPGEPNV